ncbi:MAG: hypothetical protein GC191_08220 [Azospirillum sp.]|nr:hypothetical protein [Azospirillum sp.]
MAKIRLKTSLVPATPPAGYAVLYADETGRLRVVDDAGNDDILLTSGGGFAPLASPVFSGAVTVPPGSAAAPGVVFPGASATGWFQPSADLLAAAAGGTERWRVSTSAVTLGGAPGAESFRATAVANAVNRLQVAGAAAGADVVLSVQGADTNRNLIIATGGGGNIQIGSNVDSGANPSRKLQVLAGSNTQAAVCLQAIGNTAVSYAAFDWIASNGAALGAIYHEADVAYPMSMASSAAIALKTGGGAVGGGTEQVRVAHTASAVNQVQLTGAAAGAAPALSAIGSDLDIDLALSGKGNGVPKAPTAAAGTSSTQIATTAFVHSALRETFRNIVINGCCRVSHRASKSLSNSWQYAQIDLMACKADGTVSAGTIGQASGVTSLSVGGYAAQVQAATLGSGGAVWFRHRIEARDAVRLKDGAATLSMRVYHDVGSAIDWTLTVNTPTAPDTFAAVSLIATGTASIANDSNADLGLAIADMGDCSAGIEIVVKADCGAVTGKSFTLADLQLEAGTVKTPFEGRQIALEQRLVARFLQTVSIGVAKANSASNLQAAFDHRGMRVSPAYEATAALSFTDCTSGDFSQSTPDVSTVHEQNADGGRVSCGFFSGLTSGTTMMALTSGGAVLASAEL